jgi:3'(2'), 5'-bisphosphate nucleotidase
MYTTELEFASAIVTEAAGLARRVQDEIVANKQALTKDDRSPVTIADLAIQGLVSERLAERFPADLLLAEEESGILGSRPDIADRIVGLLGLRGLALDRAGLAAALDRGGSDADSAGRRWVLDPIDGTKGFLRGDQYAVALALVVDGHVVVGVLGCPNLPRPDLGAADRGCLFAAQRGQGATASDLTGGTPAPIHVEAIHDPSLAAVCESVEAAHAAHSEQAEIARRLGIERAPVRIDSQCKYAVVARGEASVYLRFPRSKEYREKVWDHAAGSLVIEEAGGRVSDLHGDPLDYSAGRLLGRHYGIVATNGTLHDRVLEVCRDVIG